MPSLTGSWSWPRTSGCVPTAWHCLRRLPVCSARSPTSQRLQADDMIAIIDYGMGNLRSVQKGFEKIGAEAIVTADPQVVLQADRVVLPGVGAFRDCMRNLEQAG